MDILDFVEDDAGRLGDTEDAHSEGEYRQGNHDIVVGNRQEEDIVVLDAIGGIVLALGLFARGGRRGRLFGGGTSHGESSAVALQRSTRETVTMVAREGSWGIIDR